MIKLNISLPGLETTGFAYGEWTTMPTEPGLYWVYAAIGPDDTRHVGYEYVGYSHGVLSDVLCVLSLDPHEGEDQPIADTLYTHWLGPLPKPEPPKA